VRSFVWERHREELTPRLFPQTRSGRNTTLSGMWPIGL
jgi:hypothetical protein